MPSKAIKSLNNALADHVKHSAGVQSANDTTFDETLAHAKHSYSNAQEVIRFIDSKNSILIALSSAISGFGLSLAKWLFERSKESPASIEKVSQTHPHWMWFSFIIFGLSLVATVVCVAASVWSVIARSPEKGKFSFLFPLPRNFTPKQHANFIRARLHQFTRVAVLHDFEEQIGAVGQILQKKLYHSRVAAIAIFAQLILITTAVLTYSFLALSTL